VTRDTSLHRSIRSICPACTMRITRCVYCYFSVVHGDVCPRTDVVQRLAELREFDSSLRGGRSTKRRRRDEERDVRAILERAHALSSYASVFASWDRVLTLIGVCVEQWIGHHHLLLHFPLHPLAWTPAGELVPHLPETAGGRQVIAPQHRQGHLENPHPSQPKVLFFRALYRAKKSCLSSR